MSPQQTIAHYRILSKLGEGGMGEVWRATDTKLNRDVAIKVLPESFAQDPDRLARFTREAQVLASLNHPNIATIHGVETSGGAAVLVMELIEGSTLAERIAQGPLAPPEALPIARQIAEALEAAHERGIVHRDLKPANIKITPDGRVKVLDFGLATAPEAAAPSNAANSPTLTMRATVAGLIMGTAGYMSPEQAAGQPVDKRADIWAFGVVLWEMLTGRPLFEGETVSHTLADVLRADIDLNALPAGTPGVARTIIRRCLDRKLKTRLRDIGEARIAIDEYLANPTPPPETTIAPHARKPVLWMAAAGVATLALATLAVLHFREKPEELPVVRFNFGPPDNAAFGQVLGAIAPFAVSPDGQRVVFVAGPNEQLWIRPLNSLTAQPIAGTDHASYPFWSPDSRSIAFGADGKLKRIDAGGGPALTLATAAALRGGTWSREGVIVFATQAAGILQRVSAAGGEARPATRLAVNPPAVGHRSPCFLPDGRHFLFSATVNGNSHVEIWVGSLDSLESKPLMNATSNAVYSSGQLLFLRESALMAQPFDPDRLVLGGEAVPVVEGVAHVYVTNATVGLFSVSHAGVLAYATGASNSLSVTELNREGKRLSTFADGIDTSRVNISSDGKKAAIPLTTSGNSDIWIFDLLRSGMRTRFTFDPAQESEGLWSPDGKTMIFNSNRKGVSDLYRKNTDGTGAEDLLYADSMVKSPTSISPDGKFLLYNSISPKTGSDISVLPLSPGQESKPYPWLQTEFTEQNAQFSPDGKWVVYQSNDSGRSEIYLAPFTGPGGKRQVSTTGGTIPRWRRDGKELFYASLRNNTLVAVEVSGQGGTIEVAANPKELFGGMIVGLGYVYDVFPDGKRFLAVMANDTHLSSKDQAINVIQNWLATLRK